MTLIAQLVVSAFLTGLIWVVQLVIYPLFARLGREAFPGYHVVYMRRIGWVVAPAMIVELLLATHALWAEPAAAGPWIGAALVAVIWGSTALVQVPLHQRLERRGFDPVVITQLVRTNWVRTAAWSVRTGLLAAWVWAGRAAT